MKSRLLTFPPSRVAETTGVSTGVSRTSFVEETAGQTNRHSESGPHLVTGDVSSAPAPAGPVTSADPHAQRTAQIAAAVAQVDREITQLAARDTHRHSLEPIEPAPVPLAAMRPFSIA